MKRLVIVQPYLPQYRVPFFDGLITRLIDDGIQCRVVCGTPAGSQQTRGDETSAPWSTTTRSRNIRVGPAGFSRVAGHRFMKEADGVVVGLQATLADVYEAFYLRRRRGIRVGLWGHVKSYVKPPNPVDLWLERRLIRSADHVFAYTPGGTAEALDAGVPAHRVTTVMNTIDTEDLARRREGLTLRQIQDFRTQLGVGDRPCLAYIGGLDESKRIDFLADSLEHLWTTAPEYRVVIAGHGDQEDLLLPAIGRGQAIRVGYADANIKALIGRSASGVLMPGRIGLVAVDCMALGLPIVTTANAKHAPEAEYLVEGSTMYTSQDRPDRFAELAVDVAERQECRADCEHDFPRLASMIENFAAGVRQMLSPV